jgi:hypothetical protein
VKASQLTAADLGRKVRVIDATYTIPGRYYGAGSHGPDVVHKIDALDGVLTYVGASIKVEPGKLFRRVRTVSVRVGSMHLELDANSLVEYVGAEPAYAEDES